MNHKYVSDVMTCTYASVDADAELEQVINLSLVHTCVVITRSGRPVGMITEHDLLRILANPAPVLAVQRLSVADYMSAPAVCIHRDALIDDALALSHRDNIRHLPVIDDTDLLVGLLTQDQLNQLCFASIEQRRSCIEAQINERTRELEAANRELRALSLQDAMLGIGNRRAMEVDLQYTHANACRYQHSYCVALLDVDYFKLYNDHYGHQAGDTALRQLVGIIEATMRSTDRLYRYGGEELLLLLHETSEHESQQVVARILESVQGQALAHVGSPLGVLTLSAGVSRVDCEKGLCWDDVIASADKHLYLAKRSGRNCVIADSASTPLRIVR